MNIIIAGIGKLGKYLAKQLVKENNNVTVIDLNFTGKENFINDEDLNYIEGNALDIETLKEAGIEKADLLIAVMKNDLENIMCLLIGKKLGVKNTIARIRNPEYNDSINLLKKELGLSMIINTEVLTASKITQELSIPSALNVTNCLKGKIDVVSLKIKEDSILLNKTLKELKNKLKDNIIICAIERKNKIMVPNGDTVLAINDKLYITGKRNNINNFLRYAGFIGNKTKKVIIGGGADSAIYLTKMLEETGTKVTIIEGDEKRCKFLNEKLPKTLIIHGDISNQNILYEEGIENADAFVSLTSIDEENLIYSIFASSLNVKKVITKINHINLDGVIEKANIDTVITPHKIAANQVVRYIRAIKAGEGSSCEAIYQINENLELTEYKVNKDFKFIQIPIKKLQFQDQVLICAIQRGKNIIYPSGEDEIKLNDTLLIINNSDSFTELEELVKIYEK